MGLFQRMGIENEDLHFDRMLNEQLASDHKAETLREQAEEMAAEAISNPKHDYYYLNTKNMSEAIAELTDKDAFLAELTRMIGDENLDTAKFVNAAVKKYWLDYATQEFDDALWSAKYDE